MGISVMSSNDGPTPKISPSGFGSFSSIDFGWVIRTTFGTNEMRSNNLPAIDAYVFELFVQDNLWFLTTFLRCTFCTLAKSILTVMWWIYSYIPPLERFVLLYPTIPTVIFKHMYLYDLHYIASRRYFGVFNFTSFLQCKSLYILHWAHQL